MAARGVLRPAVGVPAVVVYTSTPETVLTGAAPPPVRGRRGSGVGGGAGAEEERLGASDDEEERPTYWLYSYLPLRGLGGCGCAPPPPCA